MDIQTSHANANSSSRTTLRKATKKEEKTVEPRESFTVSSEPSEALDILKAVAGASLAGGLAGAAGSLVPGYWAVPATLAAGAATGIGAGVIAEKTNPQPDGSNAMLGVALGVGGAVSGTVTGVATNLLESFTGMPRIVAGALSGSVTNLVLIAGTQIAGRLADR